MLKIWDTDPEAAPKPRVQLADVVGRFRSGYMVGRRPMSLSEWRVTTGDPELADKLATLLDAKEGYDEWETSKEDNLQVFGSTNKVHVIVDSPKALRTGMALWSATGKPIRQCDGVSQHGEGKEGKDCECPSRLADRKQASKDGIGCKPEITLYFVLRDLPGVGRFRFSSGSWQLVQDVPGIEEALAAAAKTGRPVHAVLELEEVRFVPKGKSQEVVFTKPNIKIGKVLTDEEMATHGFTLQAVEADEDDRGDTAVEPPF